MGKYLELPAYPDARPGLERLQARGDRRCVLQWPSGRPRATAGQQCLDTLLDGIVSVQDVAGCNT